MITPSRCADRTVDQWVERWLSRPRFSVYIDAIAGDRAAALELYEWNARLSAAFSHDLAHLEVGLRNAYDRALATHLNLPRHWTVCGDRVFPPVLRTRKRAGHGKVAVDVNAKPRASLERAIREAGGYQAPPGKVIAQLSFGFWRYLTSAAHETTLWRPALHYAFPCGTGRPDVDARVGRLHRLRNRVAHHETLLVLDIKERHRDLLHVAGMIDRRLGEYIETHTEVTALLSARPTPSQ